MVVVLAARQQLWQQQRQELQLVELQGAQLCSLLFNINRDQKKSKATTHRDWLFFGEAEAKDEADELPAVVAQICLALRHEQKLPRLLLSIWKDVVRRASSPAAMPEIRVLVSDDQNVVMVAPEWEGTNVRAFLAAKGQQGGSVVAVHDLDRPLMRYQFKLPTGLQPIQLEAGVLLVNVQHEAPTLMGAISS